MYYLRYATHKFLFEFKMIRKSDMPLTNPLSNLQRETRNFELIKVWRLRSLFFKGG